MRDFHVYLSLPTFGPSFGLRLPTMPSADFCVAIMRLTAHSVRFRTQRRPPEVRSTAFPAHPPNLPPRSLMTLDFAVICPLVRPGRPHIRFLSIGSRFCSTLPSDPASRRRPCASLALRRHQAGQRTSTSKLSIMLGTQKTPELSLRGRDFGQIDVVQNERTMCRRPLKPSESLWNAPLVPVSQPTGVD